MVNITDIYNDDIAEQDKIIKNPKKRNTIGTGFSGANELSGGGPRTMSEDEVKAAAEYRKKVLLNMKKAKQKEDEESDKFLMDIIEAGKPTKSEDTGSNVGKNIVVPGKPKKDKGDGKDFSSDAKSANDAELKAKEDFLKALQKLSEEKVNIIEDEFQKVTQAEITRRNIEEQNQKQEKIKLEQEIKQLEQDKINLDKEFAKKEKPSAGDKQNLSDAKESKDAAIATKKKMLEKGGVLDQTAELQEKTHLLNLRKIQEENDQKIFERFVEAEQQKIDEQRRLDEEEILKITTVAEAKKQLKNSEHLSLTETELSNIQTLEDAKAALREEADRKMLAAQLKSLEKQKKILEQQLEGMTGPAAEKLKADLAALSASITQIKSAIKTGEGTDKKKVKEESDAAKEKIDILGFSAKDWETTFTKLDTTAKKLKAAQMAVQALGNAFQAYSNLQQALNDREMRKFDKNQSRKKKELLKQLNEGYINQEEYHKQLQLMEAETANKKAEIAYKQAKTERALKIAEIIVNTSLAIMQAYSQLGPIGGTVAAVLIGTLGAVQLGTVASTPLPEKPSFDTGGFTGNGFGSPDASGFKAAGIVHENEWVAPKWMLEDPKTANVIDYLESVRTGNTKPMADGGFSSDNTTSGVATSSNEVQSNDSLIQYTAVMSDVKDLLQKLYDEGVEARMYDTEQNGKLFKKGIKKFENIETRASRK